MTWLDDVQADLRRQRLDGWLIYDFRGSNPVARPILGPLLEGNLASRRVFLMVPAEGKPTLLVHAIEEKSLLPGLPVDVRSYASRDDLDRELGRLLAGRATIAMEYSPGGDNPYVGTVDAGTLERVRGMGVEVVSSGDVAQVLEVWTPEQLEDHLTAVDGVIEAKDAAFAYLAERVRAGAEVRESEVQRRILDVFDAAGLEAEHAPNVSFGAHAGDPHYHPIVGVRDAVLRPGDVVLIDLFAKVAKPGAPYADVTWMGVAGEPTQELTSAFEAVRDARDAAFRAIAEAYAEGRWPEGAEADRAARAVLVAAGHGAAFTHRTGHSLGTRSTHGGAAHLDDFETTDRRLLRPGLGVTIEPGVYYPHFGVRSEIDVYLGEDGPFATTDLQAELERL